VGQVSANHHKIGATRIAAWRRRYLRDSFFAPVLAVIIGLVTGFCAWVLKMMIKSITLFAQKGITAAGVHWQYIALPVAGIIITGIFVRYVVKLDITHGIDKILLKIKKHLYDIKSRVIIAPMIASSFTLGFGGSAGSEGPIATTGAAIGSNAARIFGLPQSMMLLMIGCGAGAGIAGIFKSPMGGFLFTLEVMRLELSTLSVITLLASTITAAMTAFVLSGCSIDLAFNGAHVFNPSSTPIYICLGLFCGLYSLYYSGIMKCMENVYGKIANPWLKNIAGGLVLGVSLFLFPSLYGEGYGIITELLAGNSAVLTAQSILCDAPVNGFTLIAACCGILILKSFAASASNSAGGVAGDFAPTLFAGSIAGLLFAASANYLFPGCKIPVEICVFSAMGGVMAGAIRAPFMALFLTVEMTGCYNLFLPVLIVCAVSFGVVRLASDRDYFARTRFHF